MIFLNKKNKQKQVKSKHYSLNSDQLWCEGVLVTRRRGPRVPACFLDRDGVVVKEVNYLSRPQDLELEPGAATTIAALNARGIPVVVVTNQSGLARGYFDWADFAAIQARLSDLLAPAWCDLVLACPFHPQGQRYRHPNHPWRKPNPGMLHHAARILRLDLSRSVLVGDSLTDLQAAARAGLSTAAHVLTGHGQAQRPAVTQCAELDASRLRVLPLNRLSDLPLHDLFPCQKRARGGGR